MISTEIHIRIIKGVALGPILRRLYMGARPGGTFHQRCVSNYRRAFLQLQPVTSDLVANLREKLVVDVAFGQIIAKSATHSTQKRSPRSFFDPCHSRRAPVNADQARKRA